MRVRTTWGIWILLCLLSLPAVAQTENQSELKQLERDMYRYYSMNDTERFSETTERLKEVAQKVGDERTFYKAWANQAIYYFNRVGRNKGLKTAKEVREHAEQHQSKFGLYTSTYAYSSMMSNLRIYDQAEKGFKEAINYQHQFFPDESAAAPYLGLAKIYVNKRQTEKVLECAEKALAEPHIIMQHQLTAYSYKCIALYDEKLGDRIKFGQAYALRQKVKEEYGHDDSFGEVVDLYYAQYEGNYERALELAFAIKSPADRLNMISQAYSKLGNFKEAYLWFRRYKEFSDSANTADVQKQSTEYALQLDLARTENEAKDLRLANQSLELAKVSGELEQRRLAEEALNLSLRNRDVELQNIAVQLQNDSLDKHNKDLQLREYETQMKAQEDASHARRLIMLMGGILIVLSFSYLIFYVYRRRQQMRKLRDAYDRLEETTSEKERIQSELRIARDIQMGMVPSTFPAFPDRSDIDLHALIVPAKEVGGDLYDFFLQDNRLYFCIGDVSGKGVPASMTMVVAVNLFRTIAKEGHQPEFVAQKLNETLSADNENGVFVTMFIGVIDLATGRLDFCNCGHNPPVICQTGKSHFLEMKETNAPIGLWPELIFVGEHVESISGQALLLYTDGVTEAENASQEFFGEERLLQVAREAHQPFGERTPKSYSHYLIERIEQAVGSFVGDAEQSDDLTMLCVKTETQNKVIMKKELTISNEIDELCRVTKFVDEIGYTLGLDNELMMNLELVLEETVSNVIFYAHPEGVKSDITLIAESDGEELTFILSDHGEAFDPTEKKDIDLTVHPANREIGGLGIFIIKSIMNEVVYQRLEGRNLLTMKKTIK